MNNGGMDEIKTVDGLIDALGGTTKTATIFGVSPPAVSNWRRTGFPPRLHFRIVREAKTRGLAFDERIFEAAA